MGTSAGWPGFERVSLDLGQQLAGQTVRIRFRIGTDAATGAYGWELDDFDVQGLANAPFTFLDDDRTQCPPELVASAGRDVTVDPEEIVLLDANASVSNAGRTLAFAWTQVAGATVALSRADTSLAAFVAPHLAAEETLTFRVTVDDGLITATDDVNVTVRQGNVVVLNADAGRDVNVAASDVVLLDGSGSTGIGPLTYAWRQTGGPGVNLIDADGVVAAFVAPFLDVAETATFELTVSDGTDTDTDTIDVRIAGAEAVVAEAGPDQTVVAGETVVLDGSASTGPPELTLRWEQTSGNPVDIGDRRGPRVVFIAPEVDQRLVFELTATDGTRIATDEIAVQVKPAEPSTLPEDEDGCSCRASSATRGSFSPLSAARAAGVGTPPMKY